MDWFLYDNGLRHERVNKIHQAFRNFGDFHLRIGDIRPLK